MVEILQHSASTVLAALVLTGLGWIARSVRRLEHRLDLITEHDQTLTEHTETLADHEQRITALTARAHWPLFRA